jgi:hypothetical protein
MLEYLAIFCFFGSFLGMGVMVYRKIPVLINLPEPKVKEKRFFQKLKEKILKHYPLKNFSLNVFLQKILVKARILSLKLDYKLFNLIKKLRTKDQEKKEKVDDYWERLKKEIKK